MNTHLQPTLLVLGLTCARQMQQRIVGSCVWDLNQSPGLVYTKDHCCYGGTIGADTRPAPPHHPHHDYHNRHRKQVTLRSIKGRVIS